MLSEQPKTETERGFSPIAKMFFRPVDSFQATTELIGKDDEMQKDVKIKLKTSEGGKPLQQKSLRLERIATLFADHTIKSINSFPQYFHIKTTNNTTVRRS